MAKKKEDTKILSLLFIGVLILACGLVYWIYSDSNESGVSESPLTKFQENQLFGYKKDGNIVIPAKYRIANDFKNGEALIESNDSIFYINEKGHWLRTTKIIVGEKIENPKTLPNKIIEESKKAKDNSTTNTTKEKEPPPYPPDAPEIIELIEDEGEAEDEDLGPVPFAVIEEVPVFPGCESASNKRTCFQQMMQKHIADNFQYPELAQEMGVQGRVTVMFTIQRDGNIGNIRLRGPDINLENEARRIISLLPKMKPGIQRGRKVNVPFSIPITFRLE